MLKFLKSSIQDEIDELVKEGVRLKFFGELSNIDTQLLKMIQMAESMTSKNDIIQLNIMFNYGGRREILNAVKTYVDHGGDVATMTEDDVSQNVYTKQLPDPDILIRTGGDIRISNFMLWQCAYSEMFFLDIFWPDFGLESLLEVIQAFQSRDRRYGGLSQ